MFIEWVKLGKVSFPNKTGKSFFRVWAKHLLLAILNFPHNRKMEFPVLPLKSEVWNSFNKWLHFQINFIRPNDWARSPVILAVAGGYSERIKLDAITFSNFDRVTAKRIAEKYSAAFRGYKEDDFRDWILKVLACVRAAEKLTQMSLINSSIGVAEIGPGLGSMAGIAIEYSSQNFYSYDTVEMQTIQRYVFESLAISENRCTFFPINSEIDNNHVDVPDSRYVLFAFWSFTEVNLSERAFYSDLIKNSEATIIACNDFFEGVNNFEYLDNLAIELGKEVQYIDFLNLFGNSIPKFQQKHRLYTFK
jgi:hypothetical protein